MYLGVGAAMKGLNFAELGGHILLKWGSLCSED